MAASATLALNSAPYRLRLSLMDYSFPTGDPELNTLSNLWGPRPLPRAILIAVYFSLLSAFHFGWRDLNVANWIVRIQRREYLLRATGWVRSLAGIQSLVSLYLVALFLLSHFGTPFA